MSIQLFKQYTQAMVDSDWNTIASMYSEDCVSVDPDGAVFEGREANLANDQKWASMMSDFKFNYANTVESGNVTVVEMEITGTMTGEMPMPDGTSIPPTGKTHTFKACMIMEWDQGQIKKQRIYADFVSFMAGFGIMPG